MLQIGIIGLGKMGRLHLSNCRFIEDVNVVAGADPSDRARARTRNQNSSVKLFKTYEEMLDQVALDGVVIALPNFLHHQAVQAASEKHVHIFIEKPLGRSIMECCDIIRLADKNGVTLMVDHNYRFLPCVEKLHKRYAEGTLGDIEIATFEFVMNGPFTATFEPFAVPEWWFDPKKVGGGVLLDLGYHILDLFLWFFGRAKVEYVNFGYRYHLPYEDSAMLFLQSQESSAKGVINTGWFSKMIFPDFDFHINLHGTHGFLSTDHLMPGNFYIHAVKEGLKNFARRITGRKIHPLTYTYYYTSYLKSLNAFVEGLKRGTDPIVPAKEGLETLKVIEEAYQKGKMVEQAITS